VEAFFSSSSELTAAMSLIQTIVVGIAIAVVMLIIRMMSSRKGVTA
jgi:uncharacterized integral membrane protein